MATLSELEVVCQKPDWRTVGSVLARRFARPAALRVTSFILRWPVSANLATTAALAIGLAAAVCLGIGTPATFLAGACLVVLWYVADHVDGQLARYHGTESVTGLYLDYMMHHVVHPACAFALGHGLAARTGTLGWSLLGAAFALGLMTQALSNDCLYKALMGAIDKARSVPYEPRTSPDEDSGSLSLECGDLSPLSALHRLWKSSTPRATVRALRWGTQKCCEMPNVVIAIVGLAAAMVVDSGAGYGLARAYVAAMAVLAPGIGFCRLFRAVARRTPDAELRALRERLNADPSTGGSRSPIIRASLPLTPAPLPTLAPVDP